MTSGSHTHTHSHTHPHTHTYIHARAPQSAQRNGAYKILKVVDVPVVIGVLGTMSKRIHHYIKQIDILADIISIQKTAILGTAYILRRVLAT